MLVGQSVLNLSLDHMLLVPRRAPVRTSLIDMFDYRSSIALCLVLGKLFLFLPAPVHQWPMNSIGSIFDFWRSPETDAGLDERRFARVVNFFPYPVEEECHPRDKRRPGLCMNPYECHMQHGKSHGSCALGFGVCCVFTTTCGEDVQNNLTHVTSPGFPNLIERPLNCTVRIRRINRHVSQLRIDFVHFHISQPNRRTGVCDGDVMEIRNGRSSLQLCGWNSGQHVYIDAGEGDDPVTLDFRLPGSLVSRIWEMRVTQLGFEQRAPAGCLQYFRSANGTLRTMNYISNGRFLANQDYLLCVRQETGMCGISYAPCTNDSFRIGSPRGQDATNQLLAGNQTQAGSQSSTGNRPANGNRPATGTNSTGVPETDDVEGSGSGPDDQETIPTTGSNFTNFAVQRRCRNRVLIPCDFEEFITPGNDGVGICNLERCGASLCDENELDDSGRCRVESWTTPFRIRVDFGPGQDAGTTIEDNVGMCLTYEQLPCSP